MLGALTGADGATDKITSFFYQKTRELMVNQAWLGVGKTTKSVDVVRDVLRYVPIYWASEVVSVTCLSAVAGDS